MKLEHYVRQLETELGSSLAGVILYGSAASTDFVPARSDYNLLLLLKTMDLGDLRKVEAASRGWLRAGNPPPLCLTVAALQNSADVFPIELLDMKETHKVLRGEDVLTAIEVSTINLRHQLEYELKSKLIALREQYLVCGGQTKQISGLVVASLSNFLVLLRGVLRLHHPAVPADKLEALRLLAAKLDFSTETFEQVQQIKRGAAALSSTELEDLFARYLKTIESVVDKVDRHLRAGQST